MISFLRINKPYFTQLNIASVLPQQNKFVKQFICYLGDLNTSINGLNFFSAADAVSSSNPGDSEEIYE